MKLQTTKETVNTYVSFHLQMANHSQKSFCLFLLYLLLYFNNARFEFPRDTFQSISCLLGSTSAIWVGSTETVCVSSLYSWKWSCPGIRQSTLWAVPCATAGRRTGWISTGDAWGWATGHSLLNQVIWEKGHSSVSAGVWGGFWKDSRIVTLLSELNDPDLKEGLKTRKERRELWGKSLWTAL